MFRIKMKILGRPSLEITQVDDPSIIGVCPAALPFFKPKLMVKEGDQIALGAPLFFDKQDERVTFASPAAGTVSAIRYGKRRVIDAIEITVSDKEEVQAVSVINDVAQLSRDEVVKWVLEAGLWPMLRALPFSQIPNPDELPPSIIVSVDNAEPFQPQSSVVLSEKEAAFRHGIALLQRLSEHVRVVCAEGSAVAGSISDLVTGTCAAEYPHTDPGAILYKEKKSSDENKSWYLGLQDVIVLGQTALSGAYATERTIVVGGSSVDKPRHIRVREGASIGALLGVSTDDDAVRTIAGGLFRGRRVGVNDYLARDEVAVQAIPNGLESEFMSFLRLGLDKPTQSRTYLSGLLSQAFEANTSLRGSARDCISCSDCVPVCPVGLLPQLMMKSVLAGEVEDAIAHGLLDCTECGLCSYVCPSKIELSQIFSDAKAGLYKESLG